MSKPLCRRKEGVLERLDSYDLTWKPLPEKGASNEHWRWHKRGESGSFISRASDKKYREEFFGSKVNLIRRAILGRIYYYLHGGKARQVIYRKSEQGIAVQKKWNRSVKGVIARRERLIRWRDRLIGAKSLWDKSMQKIFIDEMECAFCGTRENVCVDHIFPRYKGNPLTPNNISALCKSCNSKKGRRGLNELTKKQQIDLMLSNLKFRSLLYVSQKSLTYRQ
jgi:5-methylcytosine-specific restriction endonuclease McrA